MISTDHSLEGATVQTATGSVPAGSLGFILPHEHLLWADTGWQYDTFSYSTAEERLETIVGDLRALAAVGVKTIVDPTPAEMGRDVSLMAEVSARSGVNVVFATGLYCRRPTAYFSQRTSAELADFFGTELTHGVGPGAARPGIIKLAIESTDFTYHERACMIAAASVHRQLDVPILVHCQPWVGPDVLRLLVDEHGVDGSAIVIGHAEGVFDLSHHVQVVEEYGASLGFDRYGLTALGVRDSIRTAQVVALCAMGYAGRIQLAHDYAFATVGHGAERLAERRAEETAWKPTRVPLEVVPELSAAGVSTADINLMTRVGPARWLARRM
ncbi:phosphotriesterase family protein [Microbacterium sp. A84]|uniref:phosphotriesterase family protein n=1 Tax=Microbacterium sp. A84 TaxID=3450715 RepID=UPI003F430BD5